MEPTASVCPTRNVRGELGCSQLAGSTSVNSLLTNHLRLSALADYLIGPSDQSNSRLFAVFFSLLRTAKGREYTRIEFFASLSYWNDKRFINHH